MHLNLKLILFNSFFFISRIKSILVKEKKEKVSYIRDDVMVKEKKDRDGKKCKMIDR